MAARCPGGGVPRPVRGGDTAGELLVGGDMNLREAAQQALEALEESIDTVRNEYESDWRHGVPTREKQLSAMRELVEKHEAAITALRTALAEHDPAVQRDLAFQNMARIIRELKEEQQGGQHGS